MFRFQTLFICWLLAQNQPFFAQNPAISTCCEVIASTGGSAKIQQTHFAWTVGETAIFTLRSPSVTLSQGFHQPDLCLPLVVSVQDVPTFFEVKLFPNPTTDWLNIQISGDDLPHFQLQIFDILGKKLLENEEVPTTQVQQFDVSRLPSGYYFLRVSRVSGRVLGTFRFSKI